MISFRITHRTTARGAQFSCRRHVGVLTGLHVVAAIALVCLSIITSPAGGADDLELLEQQAFQAAARRVAPSVVRIETIGGLEQVQDFSFGTGPTTGLIISSDGYVISCSFNFLNQPDSILVQTSDRKRRPARLVATDHNRMLALLKIEVADDEPLWVPDVVAVDQMRVGQWAIALGSAFDGSGPNMSVGILSALNRVWGKALQTDAAVSPNNYGGPLVDVHGRVLGLLVPLSGQSTNEFAGTEWYDSGIGFAVPAADVMKIFPRLKRGKDLYPGLMGVNFSSGNINTAEPVIAAVRPNSPASQAGLEKGDRLVEIDGRPTERAADAKEAINRRYAGETIRVVVLRNEKRVEAEVTLIAKLKPYEHPFLGILPMRASLPATEKKKPAGVSVRYVYPGSPAAAAKIEPGDLLTHLAGEPIVDADQLRLRLGDRQVNGAVELSLKRGSSTGKVTLRLGRLPESLPGSDLSPAWADELTTDKAATESNGNDEQPTGLIKLKIPEHANDAWAYVPEDYSPSIPYGIVVWLHPAGGLDPEALTARWQSHCDRNRLILLAPAAANPDEWQVGESALIGKLLDQIDTDYTIDRTRVVSIGRQNGGAMAFLVAFRERELVRAVAAINAVVSGRPPENEPIYRLAFYIAGAEKSRLFGQIESTATRLRQMHYPVTVKHLGDEPRPLDDEELAELVRWIDTLDRI